MLELAELSDETLEEIEELVPEWQPIRNRIDQWLALPSGARAAQEVPLDAALDDDNVGAVVTVHLASGEPDFDGVGEVYREAMVDYPDKPVLSYIMGGETKREWIESVEGTGVFVYDSAHAATDILEQMYWWRQHADGVENYDPGVSDPSKTI